MPRVWRLAQAVQTIRQRWGEVDLARCAARFMLRGNVDQFSGLHPLRLSDCMRPATSS